MRVFNYDREVAVEIFLMPVDITVRYSTDGQQRVSCVSNVYLSFMCVCVCGVCVCVCVCVFLSFLLYSKINK